MVFHKIKLEAVIGLIYLLHFTRRSPSATLKLSPKCNVYRSLSIRNWWNKAICLRSEHCCWGEGRGRRSKWTHRRLQVYWSDVYFERRRKLRTFTFTCSRRVTSPQVQSPLNFSTLQTRICCSWYEGLEGGVLIPHSRPFFARIPHPARFSWVSRISLFFPRKIH